MTKKNRERQKGGIGKNFREVKNGKIEKITVKSGKTIRKKVVKSQKIIEQNRKEGKQKSQKIEKEKLLNKKLGSKRKYGEK